MKGKIKRSSKSLNLKSKKVKPSDLIRIGVGKDGKNIYSSASDASRATALDKAASRKKKKVRGGA